MNFNIKIKKNLRGREYKKVFFFFLNVRMANWPSPTTLANKKRRSEESQSVLFQVLKSVAENELWFTDTDRLH